MNPLSTKAWMQPFFLAFWGVLSDYLTTMLGLGMGFCESCPQYHPVYALAAFSVSIALLTLALPREKPWNLCAIGLALASYLGTANNILVILGISTGISV